MSVITSRKETLNVWFLSASVSQYLTRSAFLLQPPSSPWLYSGETTPGWLSACGPLSVIHTDTVSETFSVTLAGFGTNISGFSSSHDDVRTRRCTAAPHIQLILTQLLWWVRRAVPGGPTPDTHTIPSGLLMILNYSEIRPPAGSDITSRLMKPRCVWLSDGKYPPQSHIWCPIHTTNSMHLSCSTYFQRVTSYDLLVMQRHPKQSMFQQVVKVEKGKEKRKQNQDFKEFVCPGVTSLQWCRVKGETARCLVTLFIIHDLWMYLCFYVFPSDFIQQSASSSCVKRGLFTQEGLQSD